MCSCVQCLNCPKTARGEGVEHRISGWIEARALYVASGRDPRRSHCGRGSASLLQNFRFLILKRRIFVNYFYSSPKTVKKLVGVHMGCIVYGWRWTCDNKKRTIHRQSAMWVAATPRGGSNLPELGGSLQWAKGVQPPQPVLAVWALRVYCLFLHLLTWPCWS